MAKRQVRLTGLVGIGLALLVANGCSDAWGVRHMRKWLGFKDHAPESPEEKEARNGPQAPAPQSQVPPQQPEVDDPRYREAVELIRQKANFSQARELLREVVRDYPRNSEAWRWLGDSHYNLMELDQAIEAYRRARELNPDNYYAMRGEGFALLYLGHQQYARGQRDAAHDSYRDSLDILQMCLRFYPADMEAMYVRAMACEGASRKLYGNALRYLNAGEKQQGMPEARNCLEVIDEGVQAAAERIRYNRQEVGPRLIMGGLYHRRAVLLYRFGYLDKAVESIQSAVQTYEDIIQDVDPTNAAAKAHAEDCRRKLEEYRNAAGAEPGY